MSSYLVTGCAGFIGTRVSERLLEQGHGVTGIDNLDAGHDLVLREWRLNRLEPAPGFDFRRVDIRDEQAVSDVVASTRPDAVINLGAKTGVRDSVEAPRLYAETNYMAVISLLESCRKHGIRKFVQASTSSVYGSDTPTPFSESAPSAMPLSPYAASKKAAEEMCYALPSPAWTGRHCAALLHGLWSGGTTGHVGLQVHKGHRGGSTCHSVR